MRDPASLSFQTVRAPASWRRVDVLSDVHLSDAEPETAAALASTLADCSADALFILGDLFEVWVGDDVLSEIAPESAVGRCVQALKGLAQRIPVHLMRGNRDFLLGAEFFRATGLLELADPTVLIWNGRHTVLSHGDALCLDDTDYQAFRAQVRSAPWQERFLAQALPLRLAQARQMRDASEERKHEARSAAVDADPALVQHWLDAAHATTLIHGHTHRPHDHPLDHGRQRIVLSDWEARSEPKRLEILRGDGAGWWRMPPD